MRSHCMISHGHGALCHLAPPKSPFTSLVFILLTIWGVFFYHLLSTAIHTPMEQVNTLLEQALPNTRYIILVSVYDNPRSTARPYPDFSLICSQPRSSYRSPASIPSMLQKVRPLRSTFTLRSSHTWGTLRKPRVVTDIKLRITA